MLDFKQRQKLQLGTSLNPDDDYTNDELDDTMDGSDNVDDSLDDSEDNSLGKQNDRGEEMTDTNDAFNSVSPVDISSFEWSKFTWVKYTTSLYGQREVSSLISYNPYEDDLYEDSFIDIETYHPTHYGWQVFETTEKFTTDEDSTTTEDPIIIDNGSQIDSILDSQSNEKSITIVDATENISTSTVIRELNTTSEKIKQLWTPRCTKRKAAPSKWYNVF